MEKVRGPDRSIGVAIIMKLQTASCLLKHLHEIGIQVDVNVHLQDDVMEDFEGQWESIVERSSKEKGDVQRIPIAYAD